MNRLKIRMALILAAALPAGCGPDRPEPVPDVPEVIGEDQPPQVTGIPPEHLERIVERFNRGVGLMDQYRPVDAIECFDEVVRLAPGWPTGRLNLGIALLNTQGDERYRRAERELKIVIAQQPNNVQAHYALGTLLRHLTRFEEAKGQFTEVLKLDPGDAFAHYQMGVLIMDEDPAAGREHFEQTLEKMPHHASACYRLQALLRKLGQPERAQELLSRFQELKNSNSGVTAAMRYGEMGRYAEIVRAFPDPADEPASPATPAFADVAEQVGLVQAAGGPAGWPGDAVGGQAAWGPGAAVTDVDSDGDLDVFIPSGGPDGQGSLYLNNAGQFSVATDSGIDTTGAIGAFFGDCDADGDPDLYLTCDGPNRLYLNDGQGHFTDITAASGTAGGAFISVGAAWADVDHDGDLDLYVANLAPVASEHPPGNGAPNRLFRNNSDGTFRDIAAEAGIDGGGVPTMSVVFFDVDDDRDLDLYLVNHMSANRLLLNDRVGRYRDATSEFSILADDGPGLGAVLGDVDRNGRTDLLLLRGQLPPRLLLAVDAGRYEEDPMFAASIAGLDSAVGGLLGDFDLDGDLDLALLAAVYQGRAGHYLLINDGRGHFDSPILMADQPATPATRGAVAADLDADGSLDLLVARAGARPELWRSPAPPDRRWLEVVPVAKSDTESSPLRAAPDAVGMGVEVKTGQHLQTADIVSSTGYLGSPPPRAHFGLGTRGKCDYVRLTWPDAVFQSELEIPGDQQWRVGKVTRKPSSCPVLFSWDGERFAFVTDILGVGGLGFFVAPGEYAPPDPTEDVRIPPHAIRARDGRYLLRIAEPLEEVVYLDQLHLVAYDHPVAWEIHPDERFTYSPPLPDGRPIAVAERVVPIAARDTQGRDVLDRIRQIDRRYVQPPRDGRFVGYADDHWIELDFGQQLRGLDAGDRLFLFLYGWTEYTYSHMNYAAYQAGVTMRSPAIEIPDGLGGWRVAVAEAGFPAGLPRMMTLDITSLPLQEDGRLRIRTNMEVFWDQIFAAVDMAAGEVTSTIVQPTVARLQPLGYPREYSPDGSDPLIYDYHRLEHGVPFKNLAGDFTRFGEVRPLLQQVDDRFVIMGRGDEIELEFDAAQLPPLPDGWSRTFVLHVDGYCKDMDLYTARGATVGPLPYHAMENYPPAAPPPDNEPMRQYRRTWNTRRVSAH